MNKNQMTKTDQKTTKNLRRELKNQKLKIIVVIIKGSLEEKLPSYEKLRSACVQVRDAKRSRLTVARVGTLGAAHVRRGCGAVAARLRRRHPSRLRHSFSLIFWCA